MSRGRGYLIPDNYDPESFGCVKVYYPDDPIYLMALLGSLTHLGTWVAWERDDLKRGVLAAQVWKNANDMTIDSLGEPCNGENTCDCEVCNMTEEELRQLLSEEIEKMTITINNTNCCCGAGGSGTTVLSGDVYDMPDDPLPPVEDWTPPSVPPSGSTSGAEKCSYANYLVYALRLTLLRAVDHTGNVTEFNDYMKSLFDFLGVGGNGALEVAFSLSFEVYFWVLSKLNGSSTAVGHISELFDEHFNYYVCQLYSSSDTSGAYAALRSSIEATTPDLVLRSVMLNIAERLPYQLLFVGAGDYPLPSGFEQRDCCGGAPSTVPGLPPEPNGYVWQLAYLPWNQKDDCSATHEDGLLTINSQGGSGARLEVYQPSDWQENDYIALAIHVASASGNFDIGTDGSFTSAVTVDVGISESNVIFVNGGAPALDWGSDNVIEAEEFLQSVGSFWVPTAGEYVFYCYKLMRI